MDFDIYIDEIEEAFQENPVIVLEKLLENQKSVTSIDIVKLTILIHEVWRKYQRYGINVVMFLNQKLEESNGTSIREYDFEKDINEILTNPTQKSAEYVININGFVQKRRVVRDIYTIDKLSQKTHFNKEIAFFLGLNGLDTIINGVLFESKNHLSSYKDIIWSKLIGIDSYKELLNRFFNENVQYDNQKRYFLNPESVSDDWKEQMEKHPKLLINKPEEKFQLDLVKFLKDNCLDTVLKEVQNDEKERYDIWVGTDQKEVYIFEIKWLGKSITRTGGVNSQYNKEERAYEGAFQLKDYIDNEERTLQGSKQSRIHMGVLLVFDAREEMKDISYPEEVKNIPNLDLNQHFKIEKNKVKASQVYKELKK
ncbi:hypothetical protein [Brevibacillus laterosporus]|uniref:hypothetical protein n=1 Tax=Brevibacillus laterosporus TaxID=1465 RepID=UPI0018CFA9F8|nr:hypothetical protein [Brevibacillus laterosporus]MBG9787023.1 hypothetical protein [Brevibacillus laterosporus]